MNSSFLQNIDLSNFNPFDDLKIPPPPSFLKSISVSKAIIFIISIIIFITIFAFLIANKTSRQTNVIPNTAVITPTPNPIIAIPSNIPSPFWEKLNQIESEIDTSLSVLPPEINIDLNL